MIQSRLLHPSGGLPGVVYPRAGPNWVLKSLGASKPGRLPSLEVPKPEGFVLNLKLLFKHYIPTLEYLINVLHKLLFF